MRTRDIWPTISAELRGKVAIVDPDDLFMTNLPIGPYRGLQVKTEKSIRTSSIHNCNQSFGSPLPWIPFPLGHSLPIIFRHLPAFFKVTGMLAILWAIPQIHSEKWSSATIRKHYMNDGDILSLSGQLAFIVVQPHLLAGVLTATVNDKAFSLSAGSRAFFDATNNEVTISLTHARAPCTLSVWFIPTDCDNYTVHSSAQRSAHISFTNESTYSGICYLLDFPLRPNASINFWNEPQTAVTIAFMDGDSFNHTIISGNTELVLSPMSMLAIPGLGALTITIDYVTDAIRSDWDETPGGFLSCGADGTCTAAGEFDWHLTVDNAMPVAFLWALGVAVIVEIVVAAVLIFWGSSAKFTFLRGMRPLVSLREIPFH
jgi:hypothetical protein